MLLPVSVLLVSLFSYSNADTTTDLLEPSAQEWDGTYGTGYWGGTSGGPNPNRLPSDTGFIWSYGQSALSTTIAINNALQQQGIQVDGYQYKWKVKNGNANQYTNQPGIDPFDITVEVYKADGTLYQTYSYDYGYSHDWTEHSGTQLFPDNYLPPSFFGNIDITAEARDTGFWAGWYGPEFNVDQSEFNLIYSANPCYNNPLYDPSCIGYAEAYAQQLFDQNCAADALYDTTCPGYASAYFTQQCSINVMYSENCPGYAEYILSLTQEEDHHNEETQTELTVVTSVDDVITPSITGDQTIDSIIGDTNELPTTIIEMDNNQGIAEETTVEVVEEKVLEDVETQVDSEPMLASGDDPRIEKDDTSKDESNLESNEDTELSRARKKVKKLVTKKAMDLANTMSSAASLDAQKLIQAEILALINFTPGFDNYGFTLAGGFYPDGKLYETKQLPESRKGLRNGLAQQILHERLVDMQWERNNE